MRLMTTEQKVRPIHLYGRYQQVSLEKMRHREVRDLASWVREAGVFLRECTIALSNFSNGFRPRGDPQGPTARENGMTRHKRATHHT